VFPEDVSGCGAVGGPLLQVRSGTERVPLAGDDERANPLVPDPTRQLSERQRELTQQLPIDRIPRLGSIQREATRRVQLFD
jgi:hypothetical protein